LKSVAFRTTLQQSPSDSQKKAALFRAALLNSNVLALGHGSLGFADDCRKGLRLIHGEISEDLTVDFDASKGQAVDELGICQLCINRTNASVDPLDPKRAEVPLTIMPVACRILVRLVDGLLCNFERLGATVIITY